MILASASPRRKEICDLLGIQVDVVPSKDESAIDTALEPEEAIMQVALKKAQWVNRLKKDDVVIGADTAVMINGRFLGKPKDKQDAYLMLKSLSGNWHSVITGVAVIIKDKPIVFAESARVRFATLTDEEIFKYLALNEYQDKAGAYAIQGYAARFIERLEGDFYTVMGLPCNRLYQVLKENGLC